MKGGRTADGIGAGWTRWPFGTVSETTRHVPIAAGESGVNLERIGAYNCRKVLQAIRCGGTETRSGISEASGLSVPAVASITTRLQMLGLVEVDRLRIGRGAPAQTLRIAADGAFGIGLCVEDGVCRSMLVDLLGGVRSRCCFAIGTMEPAGLQRAFADGLRELTDEMPGNVLRRVAGIGFASDEAAIVDAGMQEGLCVALARMHVGRGGGRTMKPWPLHRGSLTEAAVASEALSPAPQLSSFAILRIDRPLQEAIVVVDSRIRPFPPHEPRCAAARRAATAEGCAEPPPRQSGKVRLDRRDLLPGAGGKGDVGEEVRRHAATLMPGASSIIRLLNPQALLIGGGKPIPIIRGVADALSCRLQDVLSMPRTSVRPSAFGADAPVVGTAALPFVDQLLPCDAILMKR